MTNTAAHPSATQATQATQTPTVKVWDPVVRIFHWTLVLAFLTAYVTEEDYLTLHSWAGYLILGLLSIRILWGFIGSQHARFSDFVFSRAHIVQYLKDTFLLRAKRYLGHNPAGGLMILILIASLFMTTLSGLVIFGIEEASGPLAPWLTGQSELWGDWFEEIHEFFANFTVFLVLIHIAGVVVESLIHRENLAKAMVHGRKRPN